MDKLLKIHESYLDEAYSLTKNTVGFSAPVSARAYAYITLGMYESSRLMSNELPDIISKTRVVPEYSAPNNSGDIVWEVVANETNYELLSYLYRGMSPFDSIRLLKHYQNIENELKISRRRARKLNQSRELGRSIANTILNFSKTDQGDDGFLNNYPEDYISSKCEYCWVKTTPGYLPALLPYWGENKSIVNRKLYQSENFEPITFSTDSTSLMFNDALEVLEIGKSTNEEYEIIAEYWDDGPGLSGTPPGHIFQIAALLREQTQMDAVSAIRMYASLGLVLNEAFIECWNLKYRHHFIRPITYIHRYLDNTFNTRIDTPPFPESPSGHSFQSGAAGAIFIHFFGDEITFTDSVNQVRHDIVGTPRTYHSISSLVREISNSRLYGGIHFRKTLDDSLEAGKKLGESFIQYTLQNE